MWTVTTTTATRTTTTKSTDHDRHDNILVSNNNPTHNRHIPPRQSQRQPPSQTATVVRFTPGLNEFLVYQPSPPSESYFPSLLHNVWTWTARHLPQYCSCSCFPFSQPQEMVHHRFSTTPHPGKPKTTSGLVKQLNDVLSCGHTEERQSRPSSLHPTNHTEGVERLAAILLGSAAQLRNNLPKHTRTRYGKMDRWCVSKQWHASTLSTIILKSLSLLLYQLSTYD